MLEANILRVNELLLFLLLLELLPHGVDTVLLALIHVLFFLQSSAWEQLGQGRCWRKEHKVEQF